MKKKLVLICMGLCLFFWGIEQAEADNIKKQSIFSIEEPTWIFNAGMSKGQNHDRQDLGFILEKDTLLKVRQSNPLYKKNLTLWILGNSSKIEKSVSVGSEWKIISSTEATVPFVTTPFNTGGAELEYVVESDQEQNKLPIYALNEDEKAFFGVWDTLDAEYALIKGQDFQLLLPKRDKNIARKLKDFKSLDELIEHYRDLFEMYNKLAGFDGSSPVNENGKNRYFLKADAQGASFSSAYYSSNWTVNSELSADMWLDKVSWGTLHEIAHGYQTGFDGKGMYTGEVSNNLYGAQYEYEKYGKEADNIGWLFNYGKKTTVEKDLYTKMMKNSATYHSLDVREQLIMLTMLKQKAGNAAFTKMNQEYREEANKEGFNKENYLLPDLLNHYYSENSQLDFTPVLKKWGLVLDNVQAEVNRVKGYPAIASLADVVPESQLIKARKLVDSKLLITSNFEMVENSEISALNLSGTVTLKLKAENSEDFIGAKVKIKEGTKVVQEKEITGATVALDRLPNGVYTVEFIGPVMKNYLVETPYIYVKEAKNEVEIVLGKLNISNLSDQKINFLGIGNWKFGELITNLNSKTAIFSITSKTPHNNYKDGEIYVTIKVTDAQNRIKYEKSVQGTEMKLSSDIIPLDFGDQIDIYHAETKNRLTSAENIIDATKNKNSLVVTKNGLKNLALSNDPEQDLIKKIDTSAAFILQNEALKDMRVYQSSHKKNLFLAIQSLSEPLNSQYLEKYALLFPKPEEGENFKYTFKGLGDAIFATMDISLKERQAVIDTKKADPHWYFNQEKYVSILIQNQDGVKKYNKEYMGRTVYPASKDKVELAVGDYITVYHAEFKHRLLVQNQATMEPLTTKETITYQVTEKGLEALETAAIPIPKPEDGETFNYAFKGLGDVVFATMDISLKEKKVVINTKKAEPHWYFDQAKYVSIQIQNQDGMKKYKKEYIGRTSYLASQDNRTLEIGDYITIYHAEFKDRLLIKNSETTELLQTQETITYQVTEKGLKLVEATTIPVPNPEDGQNFNYVFKGLGDVVFSTMNISLKEQQAIIDTKKVEPHWYFNKEKYVSILIQNQDGVKKYNKEYLGRMVYPASQDKVVLGIGDFITVYHAEFKNRLLIQNPKTVDSLQTQETITYQVTEKGLELVETAAIPVPKPEDGEIFDYTFKGLGEVIFATMTISLKDKQAMIDTKNAEPHWYFNQDKYVSILIQNQDGVTKYSKEYLGRMVYLASQDKVELAIGDSITVYHAEFKDRLLVQNQATTESLEKEQTITYQVTEKGLMNLK